MAFLSSFYPQPVVAGTTEGTFAEGDDARIVGAAQKAANLSDLASASTARANLDLEVGVDVAAFNDSRITGAATKAWVAGVTKTVYLSARTDGVAGSGTQVDPYDASTATKLKNVLLDRTKIPAGSTVRFLSGEYQSFLNVGNFRADGGGNYGAGLPNISIIGDGINSTKITAVADVIAAGATISDDDFVNVANHGLSNGNSVVFSSLVGGVGLNLETRYYVVSSETNRFKVSTSSGGSPVNVTTSYTSAGIRRHNAGNMFVIAGECVRFSDMTIDAGWSELKTAGTAGGGVTIWGGQLSIIERIRVINHGADLTTSAEGFPIIILASDNAPVIFDAANVTSRNAIIRNCIVEQPYSWNSGGDGRGAYYTALTILGSGYNQINDFRCDGVAIIENNVVLGGIPDNHIHGGTNLDDANAFRFEFGATVGGQLKHIIIRNNTFKNLALGTQCDTWHNEHAFVEGNFYDQVAMAYITNMGIPITATIPNSGAGNPVVITSSQPHLYGNKEFAGNTDKEVVKLNTTGTLPSPLNPHTLYFVRYVSPTQFSLSETPLGPLIATTSSGSGTHSLHRQTMQNVTFKDNVVYMMDGGSSAAFRHDTASRTQRVVLQNNWFGCRNPSTPIIGSGRRCIDLTNSNNIVLLDNVIYSRFPVGNCNGFVSRSENNVDEDGLEIFLFLDNQPSRTVRSKFTDPKLNGIVLRRAINQANSTLPNFNSRSLTNKATVYVDSGNYELPQSQQLGNYIEVIGLSDAKNIRITAPSNTSGVFKYESSGIGSTIKNLTLVAPDGGIALVTPYAVSDANQSTMLYENIVFTKPTGGTGTMVPNGVVGMRGGTWINCESEHPMFDASLNQGDFAGKMYNCRFLGGICGAGFVPRTNPTEYHNSTIGGGGAIPLNNGGVMDGCTINFNGASGNTVVVDGGDIYRSKIFNGRIQVTSSQSEIYNTTIESNAAQSNSIIATSGSGSVKLFDVGSNKPIASDVTVANIPSVGSTITSTSAPSSTPEFIGQQYINTATGIAYIATGTSSSSDWKALATWNP